MGNDTAIEIDHADLTTFLGGLASDLRNAGHAVRAMAAEHAGEGQQDIVDADRLAGSLDRVAASLDGVRDHLCRDCQLVTIYEQFLIEARRPQTIK